MNRKRRLLALLIALCLCLLVTIPIMVQSGASGSNQLVNVVQTFTGNFGGTSLPHIFATPWGTPYVTPTSSS